MAPSESKFKSLRDYVEPAHPTAVKLYEDFVNVYRIIREKHQSEIDAAFDRTAQQLGFVVTTTLPVDVTADPRRRGAPALGLRGLDGTVFESGFNAVLKKLRADADLAASLSNAESFYLIWQGALRLKLRTHWMEPAHVVPRRFLDWAELAQPERLPVKPEVMEPAHWFKPGTQLEMPEAVLVSAIDEVYPELKLIDRISAQRAVEYAKLTPGIREPAHFRRPPLAELPEAVLAEFDAILRKHGF